MAMIATDMKGLFKVKIKERSDCYSDQFNRIFLVKIMLACCIIMSISWYKDSIKCIVPGVNSIDGGFVSETCWIQGLYVYRELTDRMNEVAYFGIPRDMDNDGMLKSGELCSTTGKLGAINDDCIPMKKTFMLQYQWMPFMIGAFAALYYIPYIFHNSINSDIISLNKLLKSDNPDANKITKAYFNRRINPSSKQYLRVMLCVVVKILYIFANFVALLGLNSLLHGQFNSYGIKLIKWSQLENSIAYDYMGMVDHPKPGNLLLPPFGYCELYESSKDIKHSVANNHKFVCELSQNVLYQYCLIVLWFSIVLGIIVSILGLIVQLVKYIMSSFGVQERDMFGQKVIKSLSLREHEYLAFIQKKNPAVYNEVKNLLKEESDTLPLNPRT